MGIFPHYVDNDLYDANLRDQKINIALGVIDDDLDFWLEYNIPNRNRISYDRMYPITILNTYIVVK